MKEEKEEAAKNKQKKELAEKQKAEKEKQKKEVEERLKQRALAKQKQAEKEMTVTSPIKRCTVNMGNKVPIKSPVKVTDDSSDCQVINSDFSDAKCQKRSESPLNLTVPKNEVKENEIETEGGSSHGVYFSDSEDFKKAVKMSWEITSKDNNNDSENSGETGDTGGVYIEDSDDFNLMKQIAAEGPKGTSSDIEMEQKITKENGKSETDVDMKEEEKDKTLTDDKGEMELKNGDDMTEKVGTEKESDTDSSHGVLFSDSDEFNLMKNFVEQKEKHVDTQDEAQESSIEADASNGVHFSDSDKFHKAKKLAGQGSDSENSPLFKPDSSISVGEGEKTKRTRKRRKDT